MTQATRKAARSKEQSENHIAHLMHQSSCDRCGGLLVQGHCLDVANPEGQLWINTKHCIQCGNVIDPVILKNQEEGLDHSLQEERQARPRPSFAVALGRRKSRG